ncbi:hypothetical protein [Bradyrhizobium sp. AZCC 2289]|uniref:hypothetical protein n=1 Tax=Bradyrhizobium sp. AZCC 2289 TaxID=3117026 RepID=UPI002FEEFE26
MVTMMMIKDRVLSHRIDAATKGRITTLLGNRYSSISDFVRQAIQDLIAKEDAHRNRWTVR